MTTLRTASASTTGLVTNADGVQVRRGGVLLADAGADPSLHAHRRRLGALQHPDLATLATWCGSVDLRGRGGAAFPFATKLTTAARRRALVVVNASEGEPASHKDAALLALAPHLVLDGAAVTAGALGTTEVHVVVPGKRPDLQAVLRSAIQERQRSGEAVRWRVHRADEAFVAGQARAVIELIGGRDNRPVTAWQPEAVAGHRGRPTLLSNAETFAQVASLARVGPAAYGRVGQGGERGTTLLTLNGDGAHPTVLEVPFGTPLVDVLPDEAMGRPVLVGGYHGTWVGPQDVVGLTVSRAAMTDVGARLGAGVVLPLATDGCPLPRTAQIVSYLAGQSAGRCGPCRNGLPALAHEVGALVTGTGDVARVGELVGLVVGRGACAHPDGTAQLVQTLLLRFPAELGAHEQGRCLHGRVATRVRR